MGFFRRGRTEKPVAAPDPTASAAHPTGVDAGPSWMSPEDWTARLIAYRHQGRSDADILRVVNHLQQRGPSKPRTKAEDAARARSAGVVARTEYMDPEIEARALAPNESGLPDARLQHERDRLLVVTPLGWVNPRSRTAYRAGLHSFRMAGTSYHLAAVKAGRFTPGTFVRLGTSQHVCTAAGVRLRGEHSALGDARATAELLAFYLHPKRGPGPHPEHLGLLKHISTVQWPTAPSRPPRAPNPTTHTVRRIAANIAKPPPPALVSLLADFSLVDALDEGAPSSTLSYLEMLAEAMEDGVLTQDELSALSELATTLELSPEDVESANTALLLALAHLAVDDGKVTRAEREELIGISAALGVSETLVRTVLDDADRARTARLSAGLGPLPEGWKLGTPLRVGYKVAFTGGDEQVRSALEAEATRLGVRVMSSVSSKTALLVSDGDFEGTKAATARALGLRVATSDEFAVLLRHLQPARERIRKTVPARVPRSDDGEPSAPAQGLAADLRRADPAVVRQWARENGYAVGTRGRLPAEVFAAHAAAVHARSGG